MLDFDRAPQIARDLPGATRVSITSDAVWAHGVKKWVCPQCLAVSDSGPPLGTDLCACGHILAP
jgi:hypothetical protein